MKRQTYRPALAVSLVGIMAAMLECIKLALSFLPNIEALTLFTALFGYAFGWLGIAASVVFSVIAALLDETIQIFSSRGPSIIDVWIDSFGYLAFSALVYVAYSLFFAIRRRKLQKQNN